MQLFEFNYSGHAFQLVGNNIGFESLLIDGRRVTRRWNPRMSSVHAFDLEGYGRLRLRFRIKLLDGTVQYQLLQGDRILTGNTVPIAVPRWIRNAEQKLEQRAAVDAPADVEAASAGNTPSRQANRHFVALAGIVFKLFKSAKAVKVALLGASIASWSLLFTWQFAVMLIGVIVFHEWGHLRAMQKCGLPTKGMYLIPFVGGVAVGDRPKTYWHEVYISMMGPVYGLLMTAVFYLGYLITGNLYIGAVASVSAFVNLFNLLPVYPLDGGHVLKAMVMSSRSPWSVPLLLSLSALFFALAMTLGLGLIAFFIVIGVIDLLATRRGFARHSVAPMNRYGIVFCAVWYLGVIAVFVGLMALMELGAVPGSDIVSIVLNS